MKLQQSNETPERGTACTGRRLTKIVGRDDDSISELRGKNGGSGHSRGLGMCDGTLIVEV